MAYPIPVSEPERLAALHRYGILDTEPEQGFDDLAELACSICQTPVALVTLIDEERQWFKSRIGTSIGESAREHAFCAHAIVQPDVFIIPDLTKDSRFQKNPFVVQPPHVQFYAGAPLITDDGYALGTLCVLDVKPRTLTPDQIVALQTLSRHVYAQLELRRHLKALKAAHLARDRSDAERERMMRELSEANALLLQANEAKAELLGIAAHDLRRPLSNAVEMLDTLHGNWGQDLISDRTMIAMVQDISRRMLHLLDRYLGAMSIESGLVEMNTRRIDLSRLLSVLMETYAAAARKKHQTLTSRIDPGCALDGDEDLLKELTDNLVFNAIEYSPNEAHIDVGLFRQDGALTLQVRDDGQGLSESEMKMLFKVHRKTVGEKRNGDAATGFGLAVVKRIAALHGGTVRAVSEGKHHGSTFTVRFETP